MRSRSFFHIAALSVSTRRTPGALGGCALWKRRWGLFVFAGLFVPFKGVVRRDASRRPASVMFLGRGYLPRKRGIEKVPPAIRSCRHEGDDGDGYDPARGPRLY